MECLADVRCFRYQRATPTALDAPQGPGGNGLPARALASTRVASGDLDEPNDEPDHL